MNLSVAGTVSGAGLSSEGIRKRVSAPGPVGYSIVFAVSFSYLIKISLIIASIFLNPFVYLPALIRYRITVVGEGITYKEDSFFFNVYSMRGFLMPSLFSFDE